MNIPEISLKRPVTVCMLFLGFVILGIIILGGSSLLIYHFRKPEWAKAVPAALVKPTVTKAKVKK